MQTCFLCPEKETQTNAEQSCSHGTSTDFLPTTVTNADKETCTHEIKKHNACTQYYSMHFNGDLSQSGEELLHQLLSGHTWSKFAQLLADNDQTHKFVQLITALGNQKMKLIWGHFTCAVQHQIWFMIANSLNSVKFFITCLAVVL